MITSYLIFIFARENMVLLVIGLVLFNITFAQLVTVLTLTDAIEYGQLKTGERNEAVVLAVRPMIDKLTGGLFQWDRRLYRDRRWYDGFSYCCGYDR